MKEFDIKRPGEAVTLAFDFADALPDGVTIASADPVTVELRAGADAAPQEILSGACVLAGTMVLQRVQGGALNADYIVVGRVILSDGQSRELPAILPVRKRIY